MVYSCFQQVVNFMSILLRNGKVVKYADTSKTSPTNCNQLMIYTRMEDELLLFLTINFITFMFHVHCFLRYNDLAFVLVSKTQNYSLYDLY